MMSTFWTKRRDQQLIALQEAGQSGSQIAEHLGTTRNAVIARANRIRGVKFPCDVMRVKEQRALMQQKRAGKKAKIKVAINRMRIVLQSSGDRYAAIHEAFKAGATYAAIGGALGVSKQRIHQIISGPST